MRKSKSKEGEKRRGETGGWRWGQSEAKGGRKEEQEIERESERKKGIEKEG